MSAIDKLAAAIELALEEAPVSDVLPVLIASFVGLTVELVRRQGHDATKELKIDGGPQRDITIHAPKTPAGKASAATQVLTSSPEIHVSQGH
jgi:hypothetical protein